ncbi:ABC transporter ATP-binding protein [Cupriavidus pinatubonensis]|uniref:ABC transporter ATP-binding protein n=1 Tax=Cupriavidus pinatubonensis TaxID=248026 RepID=UPI00112CFE0C|nr:ABC transporter ATP-binding protein [Cupriavidus pinatubonensis]TPQ31737.1 ABC transporter ATP-binding protein [Cupriavidus pinatubonensis]
MSEAALAVRELVAGYVPEVNILQGVGLEVHRSEIVTVLGPNGAGKSTLIKAIAGLVPVRSGSIRLFGEEIRGVAPHHMARRGLAYVPQTLNVFARLSVEENLEMGAYAKGSGNDHKRDMERMFALFPRLGERRKQASGTLSGGERQMVAVARALMANPKVLMLDEPSAGLSPKLVGILFGKVREVRELGVTILLVEQNAKAALAISDRGYVLAQGRDRVTGHARDLLGNPEVGELYLGVRRGLS